ncbi:MAG: hypothetical protein ACRC2R_06910 [Xenococcaceae cyanobacterium]
MPINPPTSIILNFPFIWMLTPVLGTIIALILFSCSIFVRPTADWAIVLYWLFLSICQWIVLKSIVSWAEWWALITCVGGIICFYLSGFVWIYITSMFINSLSRPILLGYFFTEPGFTIYVNINSFISQTKEINSVIFSFVIPSIIFFIGGLLFSGCQLLLLWVNDVQLNIAFSAVSGLAWLLGYMIFVIGASVSEKLYNISPSLSAQLIFLFAILHEAIGNFIKGSILVKVLNYLSNFE